MRPEPAPGRLPHALRVALTPGVTIFGIDVASQLSGVLMTERIFGLPGLGNVTLNAFNNYELPVLMGATLVGSIMVVFMNLSVDIGYTFLDPASD